MQLFGRGGVMLKILCLKAIKTEAGIEIEVDLDVKLQRNSPMRSTPSKNEIVVRPVYSFAIDSNVIMHKEQRVTYFHNTTTKIIFYDREQRPWN
jgi:hypothetical protein